MLQVLTKAFHLCLPMFNKVWFGFGMPSIWTQTSSESIRLEAPHQWFWTARSFHAASAPTPPPLLTPVAPCSPHGPTAGRTTCPTKWLEGRRLKKAQTQEASRTPAQAREPGEENPGRSRTGKSRSVVCLWIESGW